MPLEFLTETATSTRRIDLHIRPKLGPPIQRRQPKRYATYLFGQDIRGAIQGDTQLWIE